MRAPSFHPDLPRVSSVQGPLGVTDFGMAVALSGDGNMVVIASLDMVSVYRETAALGKDRWIPIGEPIASL